MQLVAVEIGFVPESEIDYLRESGILARSETQIEIVRVRVSVKIVRVTVISSAAGLIRALTAGMATEPVSSEYKKQSGSATIISQVRLRL